MCWLISGDTDAQQDLPWIAENGEHLSRSSICVLRYLRGGITSWFGASLFVSPSCCSFPNGGSHSRAYICYNAREPSSSVSDSLVLALWWFCLCRAYSPVLLYCGLATCCCGLDCSRDLYLWSHSGLLIFLGIALPLAGQWIFMKMRRGAGFMLMAVSRAAC